MKIDTTITKNNCFVLTGGPGAGKTTVLNQLRAHGFVCLDEVAREIIRQQVETGGNALPWSDVFEYKKIMLERTLGQFVNDGSDKSKTYFFDRGIPDIISYSKLISAPTEDFLHQAAVHYRYNTHVFLFPPWKEIYTTDKERKQNFEEAIHTYEVLKETYREYNYETIDMPLAPVVERTDFIINFIKSKAI